MPADPPLGCLAGAACREVLQASSNEIYREAFPVPRVRPGLLTCYLTCPGTAPHQHIRSHRSLHLRSLVRLADAMADAHPPILPRTMARASIVHHVREPALAHSRRDSSPSNRAQARRLLRTSSSAASLPNNRYRPKPLTLLSPHPLQSTRVESGAVHAAPATTNSDTPLDMRKAFFSSKDTPATEASSIKTHA